MVPELRSLDFAQVSDIRATYSGAYLREYGSCEIVVVSYRGRYRDGGAGKPDARMLQALGQAAVIAWEPLGIILDFSELDYRWGDNLRDILDIGKEAIGIEGLPLGVVVGPRCAEAVRSGLACFSPYRGPEWIFDTFGEAWEFIRESIADLRVRYRGILPPPVSIEQKGNADER